jgi:hypothetical protein
MHILFICFTEKGVKRALEDETEKEGKKVKAVPEEDVSEEQPAIVQSEN